VLCIQVWIQGNKIVWSSHFLSHFSHQERCRLIHLPIFSSKLSYLHSILYWKFIIKNKPNTKQMHEKWSFLNKRKEARHWQTSLLLLDLNTFLHFQPLFQRNLSKQWQIHSNNNQDLKIISRKSLFLSFVKTYVTFLRWHVQDRDYTQQSFPFILFRFKKRSTNCLWNAFTDQNITVMYWSWTLTFFSFLWNLFILSSSSVKK